MRFYYFCVAYNIKNSELRFCILAIYNIDYLQSFFHSFLDLINLICDFHFNEGSRRNRKQKTLFLFTALGTRILTRDVKLFT
jgi:hypothetical protein